jgi:ubiquinone biosynthesis monooxygenase Coq7
MTSRHYSPLDQLFGLLDAGLRTVFVTPESSRPNPAQDIQETELSTRERDLAGRLMRINHAGEIAAQGLYQGQALTAKLPAVRDKMEQAAVEENDHLNWCANRVKELGTHTSYLDPVWYLGSLTIGAAAGFAGDKWSLGFVAETEKQVVKHLDSHLQQISEQDQKSHAILEQMKVDEGKHATVALQAGGATLPLPIKLLMTLTSKVMTKAAYWI